ncbi:hypothetical protein [Streptomyces platensis]
MASAVMSSPARVPGGAAARTSAAQDVLGDLEVAGPAASLLTAQLDHAAGVGEHLGQRCHGRRDGVLTGRGERGGESTEGEVVEVAVAVARSPAAIAGSSAMACRTKSASAVGPTV